MSAEQAEASLVSAEQTQTKPPTTDEQAQASLFSAKLMSNKQAKPPASILFNLRTL